MGCCGGSGARRLSNSGMRMRMRRRELFRDCDDAAYAANGLLEGFFYADPQGGELGRAIDAGALHGDPEGAIAFDRDQFDVSAIRHERGSNPIEPGFDDLA